MSTGVSTQTQATISQAKSFYDREFSGEKYMALERDKWPALDRFVVDHNLVESGTCVEIGCGRCEHQDLVKDYTGVDLSDSAGKHMKPGKRFVQASATDLPFADSTFDGAWTIWTIEHVPGPDKAFAEIRRILKSGGVVFLGPAWQCRSWAAQGYPVRPYSDFDWKGKLIKASVPLRNWIVWRSMFVFPRRFVRWLWFCFSKKPSKFSYSTLTPNFEKYWMPDSDAINRMDPYEAMIWFRSRGDEIVDPPTPLKQFFFRTGPVVIRIRK
jgi:SAM-dependent methyltransferase